MNILLKSLTITLSLIAGLPAMENKNINLGNCLQEIATRFLIEVVKDEYVNKDFTNFQESACLLKSVCSNWCKVINRDFLHKTMVLGCQQICPEFLNSEVIYRPKVGSDEGMIVFKISDLWNPLGGTFKISQCKILDKNGIEEGNADQYLSISTGYRQENKPENANKLEIWFVPRFLVEKEIHGTASHFKDIFPGSWTTTAPVAIIWTWSDWETLSGNFDYLTTENMDNLSKINLYENWKKGSLVRGMASVFTYAHVWAPTELAVGLSCFVWKLK